MPLRNARKRGLQNGCMRDRSKSKIGRNGEKDRKFERPFRREKHFHSSSNIDVPFLPNFTYYTQLLELLRQNNKKIL